MGNKISIRNDTRFPLNISLKQVGPLYWKNGVQPGQTVTFRVGAVWFTVEVVLDYKNSCYTISDCIIPIVLTSAAVIGVVGAAACAAAPIILGSAAITAGASGAGGASAATVRLIAIGKQITKHAGSVAAVIKVVKQVSSEYNGDVGATPVRKYGVYAGGNPTLVVRENGVAGEFEIVM